MSFSLLVCYRKGTGKCNVWPFRRMSFREARQMKRWVQTHIKAAEKVYIVPTFK